MQYAKSIGTGRAVLVGALGVILVVVGAAPGSAQLRMEVDQNRIIAEGMTPGGELVLFAVIHDRRGWNKVVRRVDRLLVDEDFDGGVELVWDGGIPMRSLWVVIDLQTGEVAISPSPGFTLRQPDPGSARLRWESPSALVYQGSRYLEALLVQPATVDLSAQDGQGAWGLTVGDGSLNDSDGTANGEIRIDLINSMQPLHGSVGTPQMISSGSGVIVIVDALALEIVAVDVQATAGATNEREEVLR